MRAQGLRFAQCMRTHGVTLPDPDSSGRIPDPATVGINQGSPSVRGRKPGLREVPAALHALECAIQRVRPDAGVMNTATDEEKVASHAGPAPGALAAAQIPLADRCRVVAGRGGVGGRHLRSLFLRGGPTRRG